MPGTAGLHPHFEGSKKVTGATGALDMEVVIRLTRSHTPMQPHVRLRGGIAR